MIIPPWGHRTNRLPTVYQGGRRLGDGLAVKAPEMEVFRGVYKNQLLAILLTYMEVLPSGLVVALILKWMAQSGFVAA